LGISLKNSKILKQVQNDKLKMTPQKTYKKKSPAKIFFALSLLLALSFFPGNVSSAASPLQGLTKTELVLSRKIKTHCWAKLFNKNHNLKTHSKSPASKINEAGILFAYNNLIKVKLDNLSRQHLLIKSPRFFSRIKTIPKTSKENHFISFEG